jgi:two-component system OmpR family sensor kinase
MSLRRRLILAVAVIGVVLLSVGVALAVVIRGYLYDRVDAQLVSGPASSLALPTDQNRIPPASQLCNVNQITDVVFIVVDGSGRAVDGCPRAPTVTVPASQLSVAAGQTGAPFTTTGSTGDPYRARVRSIGVDRFIVVGFPLRETAQTVTRVIRYEVAAGIVVFGILVLLVSWISRRGLSPLAHIAATADAIALGDHSLRVPGANTHDEVGRVATALNGMLGELATAFEQQARSEERLRQFVADASHELRTPLTSIRGYADLFRHGGLRSEADLDEAMRRLDQEATRMARLVDDMLALARLDRQPELHLSDLDLVELATDAAWDSTVADGRWTVVVDGDRTVPIRADEDALRQLLANLLGNARTHTPPGTDVRVMVEMTTGGARLTVADNGPGVPDELLDTIFDRFVRADGARTRNQGGSGLGLSIAYAIAKAHGGTIRAENRNPGAAFVVDLPASPR